MKQNGTEKATEEKPLHGEEEFTITTEERLTWALLTEREAHAQTKLAAVHAERAAFESALTARYSEGGRYVFTAPVTLQAGVGRRRFK